MSFLNSALFPALLALAGVPLLIHLMNLKFPTYFPFPSVKHLRDTVAQRSKLFRWRHLVLLALRTLFVLALLFAFLRPPDDAGRRFRDGVGHLPGAVRDGRR